MNLKNREYNKPSQIEYEGTLTKNRNQRPTCDQKFLDWCVANAVRFSSYNLDIIQYKIINNSRIKSPRRGNNG